MAAGRLHYVRQLHTQPPNDRRKIQNRRTASQICTIHAEFMRPIEYINENSITGFESRPALNLTSRTALLSIRGREGMKLDTYLNRRPSRYRVFGSARRPRERTREHTHVFGERPTSRDVRESRILRSGESTFARDDGVSLNNVAQRVTHLPLPLYSGLAAR